MQRLEVSGAVRPIYGSLGVKRLNLDKLMKFIDWILALWTEIWNADFQNTEKPQHLLLRDSH